MKLVNRVSRRIRSRSRKRSVNLSFEYVEDRVLLATFTVTNNADSGPGSLRQAINDANATANPTSGADTIDFNIPSPGVHTIRLTSPLPPITEAATIDGTSQRGSAGKPLITLTPATTTDGAAVFAGDGLDIYAAGTTVQGLDIGGFNGNGILLAANGNNTIQNNYIGTDAAGSAPAANTGNGLAIQGSPDNFVDDNLISGNQQNGVSLNNDNTTALLTETTVVSSNSPQNFSRVDATTLYTATFSTNLINYEPSGQGYNLVFPAGLQSTLTIQIDTAKGSISGDYTFPSFTAELTPVGGGIPIPVSGNQQTVPLTNITLTPGSPQTSTLNASYQVQIPLNGVGIAPGSYFARYGLETGQITFINVGLPTSPIFVPNNFTPQLGSIDGRNVALVFGLSGVVNDASNNIIAGNEIGTNAAGDAMLGNSLHGIFLGNGSSNNTIGGPTDNDRNVISGNGQFPVANLATQGGVAVYIYGANTSGNVVQRNYIGTNAAGIDALTNSVIGVLISQSSGNTVQGNLISGNRFVGVEIAGSTASGNQVQGNAIGTDAGRTRAVPNRLDGIFINDAPNNLIGGTTAGAGNLISGNGSVGIQLFGLLTKGNVIEGNALGLNSVGRPTLPNRAGGIFVNTGPLNNKIGGTAPGQANRGQIHPLYTVSRSQQSNPGSTAQAATAAGRRFRISGRAKTSLRAHSTAH